MKLISVGIGTASISAKNKCDCWEENAKISHDIVNARKRHVFKLWSHDRLHWKVAVIKISPYQMVIRPRYTLPTSH